MTTEKNWLCRNCNRGVHGELDKCPICGAERPEEVELENNEEVIVIEQLTEEPAPQKKIYLFRETVLIYAADITLVLGIFFSIAALIAPKFIDINIHNTTTLSIVSCVAIFLTSLTSWALFRSIAEISRLLRESSAKGQNN